MQKIFSSGLFGALVRVWLRRCVWHMARMRCNAATIVVFVTWVSEWTLLLRCAALRLLEIVRVWVSFMQSHSRKSKKKKMKNAFKSKKAMRFVTARMYIYTHTYTTYYIHIYILLMHFQIIFPRLLAFKFAKTKSKYRLGLPGCG